MKRSISAFSALAALIVTLSINAVSTAQESKLSALLARSPSSANAMSYLHVPSLRKLMDDANLPSELSEKIEEVWLISDLDTTSLFPNWEAGYAITTDNVDAELLAKATGGYIDMVGDKKAVWTPRQSYLVPLGDDRLGFLRPAKRSLLAKWVNNESSGAELPSYLKQQATQPEKFLSFMLAVNLVDVFSPVQLADQVSSFEALGGTGSKSVGEVLASVQGVSIIVGRKSLSECIVSFEFAKSPEALVPVAAKLLNEILNRNGTAAPEVLSWKASSSGNKVSLQGAIEADTLDGILGIFSVRGHAEELSESIASVDKKTDSRASEPSESQMLAASQEYFERVKTYIERVRKYKAQSTGFRAKWNSQQARRIEEIPTLGVDPMLVQYGADVANAFRNNASAIQAGNVAAGQIQAQQAGGYGYGYYGDGYSGGYYGYSAAAGMRGATVTGAQQRMAGFGSFQQIMAAVDSMTAEIRRAMTDKYQVQF